MYVRAVEGYHGAIVTDLPMPAFSSSNFGRAFIDAS